MTTVFRHSAFEEHKQKEVRVKAERDAKLTVEREKKMEQIMDNKRRIAAEREAKICEFF